MTFNCLNIFFSVNDNQFSYFIVSMKNQGCSFVIFLLITQMLNYASCNDAANIMQPAVKTNNYIRDSRDMGHVQRTNAQQSQYNHGQGYNSPNHGSGTHVDHKNSYNLLSEAMTQAVSNEFSSGAAGSADGACHVDDVDCYNSQDRLSMEAITALHKQLDDDDNGNIDLSESDDFLREELKYDSGYEKRQKAFHFNDDMHISVKELWEAWLRSEVHNWTIEQTTDWLAQSVQLPQYVEVFKLHKVTGAALPRLAVNTMHYLSNVLGIKDPIHKQKIALKAMDVVLFGPPRETGTRWKDYILVTLLLSAIIGCWYAYQQSKNAKLHLRRMAQDMEGLQRAEQSLQEMQKELERARMEQENVASEKMDLERRLKEAPSLSSTSSDLEVQQLKKEIEMLRSELSRAEIELVDNCWAPPPQLQQWLQYTYELENKNHQKKRIAAEKQLQSAREACEKLRKKRSSFVGAFVSTHGKSIDDVDRSIVEARNALGEVTNELQERLHRWKQIETCLGFNIVNNNGLVYLENILYGRNGNSSKGSRGRITSSTDDLDEDSIQGLFDSYSRSSGLSSSGIVNSGSSVLKDDSSCSEEGTDVPSVHFYLGSNPSSPSVITCPQLTSKAGLFQEHALNNINMTITPSSGSIVPSPNATIPCGMSTNNFGSLHTDEKDNVSLSSECSITAPPRLKKLSQTNNLVNSHLQGSTLGRTPLPPPRKCNVNPLLRSQSTDMMIVPLELQNLFHKSQSQNIPKSPSTCLGLTNAAKMAILETFGSNVSSSRTKSSSVYVGRKDKKNDFIERTGTKMMTKQYSTASQISTSSTSSSVHSAPPNIEKQSETLENAKIYEGSRDGKNVPKKFYYAHSEDSPVTHGNSFENLNHSFLPDLSCYKAENILNNKTNSLERCSRKRKKRLRFPFAGHNNKKDSTFKATDKDISTKDKNEN